MDYPRQLNYFRDLRGSQTNEVDLHRHIDELTDAVNWLLLGMKTADQLAAESEHPSVKRFASLPSRGK